VGTIALLLAGAVAAWVAWGDEIVEVVGNTGGSL
jgi:hypothetical protein